MPVVILNLDEVNYLAGDPVSYALVAVDGELLFLATHCPHRGGPLHLGAVCRDARGRAGLRCPWHETFVPISQLRKNALPMVWRAHTRQAAVCVPAGRALTAIRRHPHTTSLLMLRKAHHDLVCR